VSAPIFDLLGVAGKLIGVAFLLVAAIGVLRLRDPFMRMHAATKAGTLGAGLVVIFTAIYMGDPAAKLTAFGIVVFLLATLPVAAHLLGRAAYVSGAAFEGAGVRDALHGVLARQQLPLERRIRPAGGATAPAPDAAVLFEPAARAADATVELPPVPPLSGVTVPVMTTLPPAAYRRVAALALDAGVPVTALATLDRQLVELADRPAAERVLADMRAALDRLIADRVSDQRYAVRYDETDPMDLARSQVPDDGLLVLPQRGWFHHEVELPVACYQRSSDRLLGFAAQTRARKLFLPERPVEVTRVLVLDDGSSRAAAQLRWALAHRVWPEAEILVGAQDGLGVSAERQSYLAAVADAAGGDIRFARMGGVHELAPLCQAVCLPRLQPPYRTDWYGQFWLDRIAPSWRGELLVP
jgi:monovalent cation/proton antiporter MnhG/PhaG subunit